MMPESPSYNYAARIAALYGELPQVEAVALGGSQATESADERSDVDLYVYVHSDIPQSVRAEIAMSLGERIEVDNHFWELGDEWVDSDSGIHADVMFRNARWLEDELDRVLKRHEASIGYSTCVWHNVLASRALFDANGWFRQMQDIASQPYPEELREAIVARNFPILKDNISSYYSQLDSAVSRGDFVSINHRVAAILASYFDILFAVNSLPHPGEKRLLQIALERCMRIPHLMERHVTDLLLAVSAGDSEVLMQAELLIEGMESLLRAEGLV